MASYSWGVIRFIRPHLLLQWYDVFGSCTGLGVESQARYKPGSRTAEDGSFPTRLSVGLQGGHTSLSRPDPEWSSFGDIPFYIVQTDTKDIVVNANKSDGISLLNLRPEEIRSVLSQIHGIGTTADIKLLDAYDTYYISRKRNLELPVWKVSIQDVDNSCYYINPRNGQYRYVNTPSRWNHWMYPALHSLNLKFLVDHPVLWNIVMWGTMLGGTFVSLSGVWLAIKYIRRKARRKK